MATNRNPSFVNVSGPLSKMPGGIQTEPLTLERSPSTLFIRFHGPTLGQEAAAEAARIAAAAIEVAADPLRRVVLDLSALSGISSLGLGTCLDLRRRADARGAEVVLLGLNPHLQALFATMRLDRLFVVEASAESLARRMAAA
ncbi:MAG: STAS domain-containing protein [Phycisphaerales bacterium]|jgi:anti-anti-sigma factor